MRKKGNLPGQPHCYGKFFLQHLDGEFNTLLAIVLYTRQRIWLGEGGILFE